MIQNFKFSVSKRRLYFEGIAEQNDKCDISLDNQGFVQWRENQMFYVDEQDNLHKLGHWGVEPRACVKQKFWPEVFDKNSPLDKAKVYHTGRIQLTYEYNINISSIV